MKRKMEDFSDEQLVRVFQKGNLEVSSTERDSIKKEFRRKLKEAIDSLPTPYKTSFVLIEFRGMSHKQASLVLRCSENTVSWRIHKARKMLQNKLKPYFERGIL